MKAVAVKAEVSGEAKALNYMAKCFPMNELRVDWLKKVSIFVLIFLFRGDIVLKWIWIFQGGMFATECTMYSDIVPALRKFDQQLVVPATYLADPEEGIMIMENLKLQDFYMGDKIKGMQFSSL